MILSQVVVMVFLILCSYLDVKYRRIPVSVYLIFMLISAAVVVCEGRSDWRTWMIGMIPGIIMIVISFISHEKIGYGDSVSIALMGILYKYEMVLSVCAVGFGIIFLAGLIMMITGKAKLSDRLPFMPFLMAGNIWVVLAGVI